MHETCDCKLRSETLTEADQTRGDHCPVNSPPKQAQRRSQNIDLL